MSPAKFQRTSPSGKASGFHPDIRRFDPDCSLHYLPRGQTMHLHHEPMSPVFDKWHVHGLPVPAVFHRFTTTDTGPPHDHPWAFRSVILTGGYTEEVFALDGTSSLVHHAPGDSFHVPAEHIHRIVDLPDGECFTLIMPEPGPDLTSGFYEFRDGIAFHRFWHEQEFKPI